MAPPGTEPRAFQTWEQSGAEPDCNEIPPARRRPTPQENDGQEK